MGLPILKPIAFVLPLGGLVLLMGLGERADSDICLGNLAMEKSQQIVEGRPGVVDTFRKEIRWGPGCQFALQGYADMETAQGFDRTKFEVVMDFDRTTRRWQQISLAMPQ